MNVAAETALSPSTTAPTLRYVLFGGLLAGLVDFLYPTISTVMAGGSWMRPWKGVAGGLLGATARDGGLGITMLGIFLHFFICVSGAFLLYFLARRITWIPRQWIVLGILYGIAVLLVMNYIILPLSAIGRGIYPLETLHISALSHILVVGLPTAFFVSKALQQRG